MSRRCQGTCVSGPKKGEPCERAALAAKNYCGFHKSQAADGKRDGTALELDQPLFVCHASGDFELLCYVYNTLRNGPHLSVNSRHYLRLRLISSASRSLQGNVVTCINIEDVKDAVRQHVRGGRGVGYIKLEYATEADESVMFVVTSNVTLGA